MAITRRSFLAAMAATTAAALMPWPAALPAPTACSKYPPWDVRHWGALGDGVHNDGPAISRAMDYVMRNGGGMVSFGSGFYRVAA